VLIHHVLAEGTFDEQLIDILEDRDATQNRITDAVKYRLSVA